jgi:hypothetical protein
VPQLRGHTGPVVDVKFSPFRSNLLATASDDSTVRLWEIPQGGLTEHITAELQRYTGHARKVGLLSYNPTVAEVIASAGFDNTVQVWNICNGENYCKFSVGDVPLSLDWNHNGSLVGFTTKEKLAYIADPRQNKVAITVKGHDSSKSQKMLFINNEYFFTCGFNRSNERQIKLFDMRALGEGGSDPVQVIPVDAQAGIMLPFYDADTGLIYVPGRGEGNIKYFDYSSGSIKFASEYKSTVPQKGIAAFPKRTMNYNKCEIARFAKLTTNSVEYLSFYIPKRNEGYDASAYPDCITGEAALSVEEWIKGDTKDPVRKPITSLENSWTSSEMTFEKKNESSPSHEEKKEEDLFNRVILILIIILGYSFGGVTKRIPLHNSRTRSKSLDTKLRK